MISFSIMHCDWDPLRRAWLELVRAEVPTAIVVRDELRSCWDTAKRAWQSLDGDHCLVLQDDMLPSDGFTELVGAAVKQYPDHAISFRRPPSPALVESEFWPGYRVGKAGFHALGPGVWGGSVVLPRRHVAPMIAHGDTMTGDADDERISSYLLTNNVPTLHYAPELLHHVGERHSLLGHTHQMKISCSSM